MIFTGLVMSITPGFAETLHKASQNNLAPTPKAGVMPLALMRDPIIEAMMNDPALNDAIADVEDISTITPNATPPPVTASAQETVLSGELKASNRFKIAVVPDDFVDEYQVSAFDSRRGDMDCKLVGGYAQCVYRNVVE